MVKQVNWQIEECKFGFVLICTYNGDLCGIEFNKDDYPLIVGLTYNFNFKSNFVQGNINPNLIQDILSIINNGEEEKNIKYKLLGTPFQMKVWEEVSKIPKGTIKTYGEIATTIGHPKAYRAVGTACNHNHLGIIVPCHRVVPADGSLGKYAWGEDMKRQLLEREGVDVKNFKFKFMRKPKNLNAVQEIQYYEDKDLFKTLHNIINGKVTY